MLIYSQISRCNASYRATLMRSLSNIKKHYERRMLPFSVDQCYNVVADVAKYNQFVPWVKKSTILTPSHQHDLIRLNENNSGQEYKFDAELEVGFSMFSERYTSHVTAVPNTVVTAMSTQTNLFEKLRTEWKFTKGKDSNTC